jgi:hypothetical protein
MTDESDQSCGQNIYEKLVLNENTQQLEAISFAEWIDGMNGSFDLLKLDCEGVEWEIIQNTPPRYFARFGLIVAELHADPEGVTRLEASREFMEEAGFKTILDEWRIFGLCICSR